MTISSQKIFLGDWSLLMSQRQEVLKRQLSRVAVTPHQQGTLKNEGRSTYKCRCKRNTNGCQVSDLDEAEFYWENDQLVVDAVCRPEIANPVSPIAFDDLEIGCSAENPILIVEEEEMENSPTPTNQSLGDQHDPFHCWEVVHLEQE